ncbi:MAG: flagellar motor protein MotB [Spirochaetaceae bacterium]|jgi:chemotaxis protein MotB|nr:flagellar motor protein MotB [Spirochaetaceae bacterium]
MAKKKKEAEAPSNEWMGTYGDMITLMLCFFVMLYNPSEVDPVEIQQMLAAIESPTISGGQSASAGTLSDLGNTITSLPSMSRGSRLGPSLKRTVSIFAPDVKTNRIAVTSDERALVISLAGDAFFAEGSAELNMDATRDTLMRLSQFLSSSETAGRRFRIEGHTDDLSVENTQWPSNWELSAARAINVLRYLSEYGIDEKQFSVAGYADTRPRFPNTTAEARAYNRRVDIVILEEGHL